MIQVQTLACPRGSFDPGRLEEAPQMVERMVQTHMNVSYALAKARRMRDHVTTTCLENSVQRTQAMVALAKRYHQQLQLALVMARKQAIPRAYNRLAMLDGHRRKLERQAYGCQGDMVYQSGNKHTTIIVTHPPCP